jgi:hypothetical protein
VKANSDIGLMMPEVRLFHSRKKFVRYYKRHYGEKPELFDTEGQMTYRDGEALVLMTYVGREDSELGLLVHEAYHAAVAHMALLGEDEAGEETMAYLIQSISHGLFDAHRRWKGRKGLVE